MDQQIFVLADVLVQGFSLPAEEQHPLELITSAAALSEASIRQGVAGVASPASRGSARSQVRSAAHHQELVCVTAAALHTTRDGNLRDRCRLDGRPAVSRRRRAPP